MKKLSFIFINCVTHEIIDIFLGVCINLVCPTILYVSIYLFRSGVCVWREETLFVRLHNGN